MKDYIIYINGGAEYRCWATDAEDAMKKFVVHHGPWNERPGYNVYAKEFGT